MLGGKLPRVCAILIGKTGSYSPSRSRRRRGVVDLGGNARIPPPAHAEVVAAGRSDFRARTADDRHRQDYEGQTAVRVSKLPPPSLVTR